MRLLDIILALDTEDRRALSAIWIERAADGGWQARCSIARDRYYDSERTQGTIISSEYAEVDARDLPHGVGLTAWERVPDQVYPLSLDEINRDADMRAQAAAVQDSGLLGNLDMARYDRQDRTTRYLIKSHAGSGKERTAWLLSLRERPENTIYLSGEETA